MKRKISMFAIAAMMTFAALSSCGFGQGKGDVRDRNLEQATLSRPDTIPNVEYVGMSDVHDTNGGCNAVVIYYVTDSLGNKSERNARVTANDDCSEIYSWENLDCQVLGDVKQKVTDKMEEKGIDLDGSLIDALIEIKRKSR